MCYIGISGLENTNIIDATNAANVTQSTCQIDFAINSPTNSAALNGTRDPPQQSATVAVLVISIVGGILGFCIIIIICIVGLLVIKNKKKQGNIRKEIITQQPSNFIFNRYMLYLPYSGKLWKEESLVK